MATGAVWAAVVSQTPKEDDAAQQTFSTDAEKFWTTEHRKHAVKQLRNIISKVKPEPVE